MAVPGSSSRVMLAPCQGPEVPTGSVAPPLLPEHALGPAFRSPGLRARWPSPGPRHFLWRPGGYELHAGQARPARS